MIVEIRGAAFVNKGAELMLRSVIAKMRKEFPQAILAMEPDLNEAPYEKRAELGLYQKLTLEVPFINHVPKTKLRKYGIVHYSEVDVVLDASGYMYGDIVPSLSEIAEYYQKVKKKGGSIILLPQAFGPFNNDSIKSSFVSIAENADLIYTRDLDSYNFVKDVVADDKNVKMAPDFTNLLEGTYSNVIDEVGSGICLIPNYRMIDKTAKEKSEQYVEFLINISKYLVQKNTNPFFLIHEGEKDLWIANEVVRHIESNIKIIREDDPLKTKFIIGKSLGVIGSRYHGLISALSQGVPTLGTSWSHKYEMLFKDYGFEEGIIDITDKRGKVLQKIELLLSHNDREIISNKLKKASASIKKESNIMWDDVVGLIKNIEEV